MTGATGFIAAWIIQQLLEDGYHVRGTVRSAAKGASLQKIYAQFDDQFEPFIVRDMTEVSVELHRHDLPLTLLRCQPGAYDDAVKGMDTIMHVASPCRLDADDPKEVIDPAVSGTFGVLASTLKHGSSVRRVVVTSSCAAVLTAQPEFRVFDENDWNDKAVEAVKAHGREASPVDIYCASKALAERAAWKFVEQHRGEVQWELATIHPPWVFGPVLGVDKPEHLNTSMAVWWKAVDGAHDNEYLATVGSVNTGVVHRSHTDYNFSIPESQWRVGRRSGCRISAHTCDAERGDGWPTCHCLCRTVQTSELGYVTSCAPDWATLLIPNLATIAHSIDARLPAGDASYDAANAVYAMRFDASKSKKLLGLEYRTMEQTTKDIISQFQEKGWIV